MSDQLPPLPPGFVVENAPQALPPLPPGFQLEAQQPAPSIASAVFADNQNTHMGQRVVRDLTGGYHDARAALAQNAQMNDLSQSVLNAQAVNAPPVDPGQTVTDQGQHLSQVFEDLILDPMDPNSATWQDRVAADNAGLREDMIARAPVIAEHRDAAAAQAQRPVIEGIGNASSIGEMLSAFANDPTGAIAGAVLRSLPQAAPGIALGAVNPAAGATLMGTSSGLIESGGTSAESLAEQGIDIGTAEGVDKALQNEDAVLDASTRGDIAGAIIGAVDAATGGLAGASIIPKKIVAGPVKNELANMAAQSTVQAIAGGGAEAGKQVALDGDITQPGAIFLEVIGEAGGAPIEVAGFGRQRLGDAFSAWAQSRGRKPGEVTNAELQQAAAEGDKAAMDILRGAGMTDEQISGMSPEFQQQAAQRVEGRRAEDAARAPVQNDTGSPQEFSRFQRELDRQQAERAGVEAGDIDPAAVTPPPQRQPLPGVIPLTPGGQANVAPAGSSLDAGQQLRSEAELKSTALVPVDPNAAVRRGEMTPDEVAQAQRQMEAGQPNTAVPPARMAGAEGRAPQTPDDAQGQREAGEAFTAAEAQRGRVADGVLDSQAAGRPQGVDAQPVYLDDGFPVQVIERTWVEANGKTFEAAKVQRYDPRTGQPDPDSEPYLIPAKTLKRSNYATDPRQAQDFADRAQGPRSPERPRMDGDPVTREPNQTYRATPPDPEVPGATGPASNPDSRGPIPRAARPEQQDGPGPWRQRSQREEDFIRDYQAREEAEAQARARGEQSRQQRSQNDYGNKTWGDKFSSKAADQDGDGRYGVDDVGHVLSDKGGPVRFGDQKQAAKWILNVGQKNSPDQFFEIANHPSGKGFTVREAGRNDGGNQGGPQGGQNAGQSAGRDQGPDGAPGGSPAAPDAPRALPGPRQPETAQRPASEPAATPQTAPEPDQPAGPPKPSTIFDLVARLGGIKDAHSAKYRNTGRGNDLKRGGELDALYDTDRKGRRIPKKVKMPASDDRTLRLFGRPIINSKTGRDPDYVREAAVEAGFLPPGADINDLYAALNQQATGTDVFAEYPGAEADADSIRAWRDSQEEDRLTGQYGEGPSPDADPTLQDEDAAARDYIAAQLDRMGENIDPDADVTDLAAQLDERLAMADAATVDQFLDGIEADQNGQREGQGNAVDQARGNDALPAGENRQDGSDAAGAGRSQGQNRGDRGRAEAAPQDRPIATERTDQGEQSIVPGAERSAHQAQQSRDAGSGRLKGDKPQKAADEGLFGGPSLRDFFDDERGGVDLDALAEAFKKAGMGVSRAILDGPLGRLVDAFINVDVVKGIVNAIRKGAITGSMRSEDGRGLIHQFIQWAYYSNDGRMRAIARPFKSKTLDKVINQISSTGGNLNTDGMSYEAELKQRAQRRSRQVQEMLAPILDDKKLTDAEKKAMLEAVVRQVQSGRVPNKETRIGKVALAVKKFLKEELDYMRAAGVDVGEIKDGYYPREIDREAVIANQDRFLRAATKLYMDDPATRLSRDDARAAASAWLANILNESPGSPHEAASGGKAAKFTAGRVFGKLMEQRLDDFLLKDPDVALTSYAYRAAKAAAIARRFGDRFSKWQEIEQQIIEEGAANTLQELRGYVSEVVGIGGGIGGMSSMVRKGSALVRTWTTLMLLEKAALASLSEPFIAAARTGNLWDGLHAAVLTTQDMFRKRKGSKSEMRELAEDVGAIAGAMSHAVMSARFTGEDMAGKAQQRILAEYFSRTGLETLTNSSIVAQTKIGAIFMRRLARDIAKGGATAKSSRIFMRELGIPDSDVDAVSKAIAKLGDELPTVTNMPGKVGEQVRNALFRFQTEVIQQPTRASRPAWANHPLGAVVFQLASWSYSFTRNVLGRSARMALRGMTEKDLAAVDRARLIMGTLPGLALVYAASYGIGELRDDFEDEVSALWSPDGKSTRRKLSDGAKLERAASRAGLFGVLDPLIQLWSGARYGRDASSAVLGPGLGQLTGAINDTATYFMSNSDRTNTAERKIAGKFYDLAVEPTLNLALTMARSNPVTGALSIAVIPGMREAFVSEAAGRQSSKDIRRARKTEITGLIENFLKDK